MVAQAHQGHGEGGRGDERTGYGSGNEERRGAGGVNVGDGERLLSIVAGSALAAAGLRRPSVGKGLLALLGGYLVYRGATGHCGLYESMGVQAGSGRGARPEDYFDHGIHVERVVTIGRWPEELFAFWRNFENLPRFMEHLERVDVTDERRSHWVAKGPAGSSVEWDAEIINEEAGHLIAWKSMPGADVDNTGSVRFIPSPGGRGTQVKVNIEYIPPAGKLGRVIAQLFGEDPGQQIREDLRRFKRLMETGEIPTIEGQSSGSRSLTKPRHEKSHTAPLAESAGAPHGVGRGEPATSEHGRGPIGGPEQKGGRMAGMGSEDTSDFED